MDITSFTSPFLAPLASFASGTAAAAEGDFLQRNPWALTAFFVLIAAVGFWRGGRFLAAFLRYRKERTQVRATGLPARAVIVDPGVAANTGLRQVVVEFVLQTGQRVQAVTHFAMRPHLMAGELFEVQYDPADPGRVHPTKQAFADDFGQRFTYRMGCLIQSWGLVLGAMFAVIAVATV